MNTFDWMGSPSATGQRAYKSRKAKLAPAERMELLLRQHSIGGLPLDEIKLRVSAQREAIFGCVSRVAA